MEAAKTSFCQRTDCSTLSTAEVLFFRFAWVNSTVKPLISVVIPTCARLESLSQCLNGIAPIVQGLSLEEYEVIISDDGPGEAEPALIREKYPWARWVCGPRRGPAANRNHGAKFAQGEWLVFTDDDCLPDPDWLSVLRRAMAAFVSVPALEGAVLPIGSLDRDLAQCPINAHGGCFWSANVAIKSVEFQKIGGFDESYPIAANEDQDIFNRLGGHSVIPFIKEAVVRHPVRYETLATVLNPSRFIKAHRSWAYHVAKNSKYLGFNSRSQTALYSLRWYIRNFYRSAIRLQWRSAIVCLVEIFAGLPLTAYFQCKCGPRSRADGRG
jgi:GT2 family glycosyltransferase